MNKKRNVETAFLIKLVDAVEKTTFYAYNYDLKRWEDQEV